MGSFRLWRKKTSHMQQLLICIYPLSSYDSSESEQKVGELLNYCQIFPHKILEAISCLEAIILHDLRASQIGRATFGAEALQAVTRSEGYNLHARKAESKIFKIFKALWTSQNYPLQLIALNLIISHLENVFGDESQSLPAACGKVLDLVLKNHPSKVSFELDLFAIRLIHLIMSSRASHVYQLGQDVLPYLREIASRMVDSHSEVTTNLAHWLCRTVAVIAAQSTTGSQLEATTHEFLQIFRDLAWKPICLTDFFRFADREFTVGNIHITLLAISEARLAKKDETKLALLTAVEAIFAESPSMDLHSIRLATPKVVEELIQVLHASHPCNSSGECGEPGDLTSISQAVFEVMRTVCLRLSCIGYILELQAQARKCCRRCSDRFSEWMGRGAQATSEAMVKLSDALQTNSESFFSFEEMLIQSL